MGKYININMILVLMVWIGLIFTFPSENKKPLIVSDVLNTAFSICKHEAQNGSQLSMCVDSNRRAIAYYEVEKK